MDIYILQAALHLVSAPPPKEAFWYLGDSPVIEEADGAICY
jgi:hypothetical protein